MLHGEPFFIAKNSLDHLLEIIKVMGTPSKEEVLNMNPDYDIQNYNLPKIVKKPLEKVNYFLIRYLEDLTLYFWIWSKIC